MGSRGPASFRRGVLLCALLTLGAGWPAWSAPRATAADSGSEQALDFARDIQPILAERCLACHSGEEPEGGLDLGVREKALRSGESGVPAIVAGRPDESELIRRITSADADERMPPEGEEPILPEEIEKLKRWITDGARWSGHWAFQPLTDPEPPAVENTAQIRNDIDRFVLARLEQVGAALSPPADRYTLIKRLSYDLLGLPPTIEQVDAFVGDPSPTAYEDLVDRLLRSPHFGERWGRHWLDLAHYADSDGYEKDRARPDAYLYRDWIIQAINDDMPFDRFTVEQLAGDLLPGATARQRIATGFLRQTLTNEEGGVDQEEYRVAANFDRTETVGTVWLGLTIGCVRCHTHKYDPLPHEDYYKFFAFFNGSDEVTSPLPVAAQDMQAFETAVAPLEAALAERYRELAADALAWETAQHQRIMAEREIPLGTQPVEIVSFQSTAGAQLPQRLDNGVLSVDPSAAVSSGADKADYEIVFRPGKAELTGLKLWALADDGLPGKGPGLADNGNFVLTGIELYVVAADGTNRAIPLHRPQADFAQEGFPASALPAADPSAASGWAIAPKTGESHWIEFRTFEPISFAEGDTLRLVLRQQYGARHLLGRLKLEMITGGERGLYLANKEIADALEMYPEKRVYRTREQLFEHYVTQVARDEKVADLRRQIQSLRGQHAVKLEEVRWVAEARLPRVTKVFHRGDFLSPTDPVDPGVPAVLAALTPLEPDPDGINRINLARWLVNPGNCLTPRVAANRVWQRLFGEGLVRTPNDLGTRGQPPTHPELLDWLASRFKGELGWSQKALIRLIVTSATYCQSSVHRPEWEAKDPLNTLVFRQNRFRVESEIVRDLHLAVSGLLSPRIGGPSVFPPMPEDLAKLSYANSFSWVNSEGEDRYRRGMYTFFKRTIPHPNLMTFDSPDANVACVMRTVSNTPLQALTLLNNEVHIEAAQALARRLLEMQVGEPSDTQRLTLAVRLCVARPPRSEELQVLARVLESGRRYYAIHGEQAQQVLGGHVPPEVSAAEAAAWVSNVRVVLNMDEFITRE